MDDGSWGLSAAEGSSTRQRPEAFGLRGMVSSAHPVAAFIGLNVMQRGGNAFDAAIAVAAVEGVVLPMKCGLGGDAFVVLHDARKREVVAYNGSGVAAAGATAEYYASRGYKQMPLEGVNFKASLNDPAAPSKSTPQYFEQFGHRGLWQLGWKAVAYHPPGTAFDADRWELYDLARDFSETNDLAAAAPDRLAAMIESWWQLAERHNVLPLDDRFRERFAENAANFHGARTRY